MAQKRGGGCVFVRYSMALWCRYDQWGRGKGMFFYALAPISGGLTSCGGSSGGVVPITRPMLAVAVYGSH